MGTFSTSATSCADNSAVAPWATSGWRTTADHGKQWPSKASIGIFTILVTLRN